MWLVLGEDVSVSECEDLVVRDGMKGDALNIIMQELIRSFISFPATLWNNPLDFVYPYSYNVNFSTF